jgi:small subunit ribosomal protein S4
MRYTKAKARLCRREGVNLFGSDKYQRILARKGNIPGMHGDKRRSKVTEYGKQLREKQKAKRMFGLSEKQFRRSFDKGARMKGVAGFNLLQLLELRLDNLVYRAGFAMTRAQARQFVSHGLFMVNGRRVTVPSIQVRPGDMVSVRESRKNSPVFRQNIDELQGYNAPDWIKSEPKKFQVEVLALPNETHFEGLINPQMIVEFYSR